jgi:hypothetical protein
MPILFPEDAASGGVVSAVAGARSSASIDLKLGA